MPFANFSKSGGKELIGGILFDIIQQVASNAGAEAQIVILPPKRSEAALAANAVDLQCLVSPSWMVDSYPAQFWSVALFRMEDVWVAPANYAGGQIRPNQAAGASVGLVISYAYPDLEPALRSGQLRREDALSQELVLEKLLRGRSDYAVVNSLIALWFNKGLPASSAKLQLQQTLSSTQTHCLLSKQPGLAPERIKAAVQRLVASGQLQAILGRYR